MTQEEKLKEAKRLYETANSDQRYVLESLFPELKESEDERIRKSLIILLQHFCKGYRVPGLNFPVSYKDMLAWLEKQGEQEQDPCEHCKDKCLNCHNFPCIEKRAFEQGKSVFDVINEEKVDNADKVEPKFKVGDWITNGATKPAQISSIEDDMYYTHNGTIGGDIESMDKDYHLWTISDAKDGDVLYSPCCKLLWIYKDDNSCYVGNNLSYNENCVVVNCSICIPSDVCPATKEQRDLLFQKMKEAGYEWDAEKKELKKIEQKPSWSEKDEKRIKKVMHILSLDGRISNEELKSILDWLKSLKERYTWKPSKEQMEALKEVCDEHWEPDGLDPLYTLYQDLKKLKE